MLHRLFTPLLSACLTIPTLAGAAGLPHHDLRVTLKPAAHTLEVTDLITLGGIAPDAQGAYRFVLHAGLHPAVLTKGWTLQRVNGPVPGDFLGTNATTATVGDVPLQGYRLIPSPEAKQPVVLRYGGLIDHPLALSGKEYQRSFSETPGLIGQKGVFLSGTSFWVPAFGDGLVTFDIETDGLNPPWDVVSQGERTRHVIMPDGTRTTTWNCRWPQEEIYLVAGPWHEFDSHAGKIKLYAFLREPDAGLATRYLKATVRYLKMDQGILPPYPYPSFALVENFWETGYGMPGFTLLGSRILRFPWILTSSYPHELLHNWWGNSVYVDFQGGNWCEGLTAYMADHLFAEQKGRGVLYRRSILKKFSDFAKGGKDFPLTQFHNRFSAASEAVGYGKSLMLFHMVRRSIGDRAFLKALRNFYTRHRFTRARFSDLAAAFSNASGRDWTRFFTSWTTRTGAPRIEIASVTSTAAAKGGGWTVHVTISQTQEAAPFPVEVPLAITTAAGGAPIWKIVPCDARRCSAVVTCSSRPLRLDVDPAFDVMRRLDPKEVPPALSTLFGAAHPTFILPSTAPASEIDAWRMLATSWAKPGVPHLVMDRRLKRLPAGSVWVLGRTNRFAGSVIGKLAFRKVTEGSDGLHLRGATYNLATASVVLVARGTRPSDAIGLITAAPLTAISGLARKLPHYTKYSYLVFNGSAPSNVAKGMWKPAGSPLVRNLGGGTLPPLQLPKRTPLAQLPPEFDAAAMKATVDFLASPKLEGRGLGTPGLAEATAYAERKLAATGLKPAGDDGFRQSWTWTGGPHPHVMKLTNLLAEKPGTDPALADHPVLVTAHIDHLGRGWPDVRAGNEGKIHPGADDNASGDAVLLELARVIAQEPPHRRPILFALVTGEEAGLLGSRHLAASMAPDHLPYADINLDTVGRLREGKLYVLNTDSAREWPFIWMGVRATTGAPITPVSEPLDASDQGAFLERGIPAVQLFSGPTPDYHRPSDTPDKIDAAGMAVVAEAAHEAITYLADRTKPLTVTISEAEKRAVKPRLHARVRRVSLGTMPDFSYGGPGVRIQAILPGSPAQRAGLVAGDVITALDGQPIADLRAFSNALKAHKPGDRVAITVRRGTQTPTVHATLAER